FRNEIFATPRSQWLRHLFLFMCDREAHTRIILSSLFSDFGAIKEAPLGTKEFSPTVILQDRSYHSSCVYQGIAGNVSPELILKAHKSHIDSKDDIIV